MKRFVIVGFAYVAALTVCAAQDQLGVAKDLYAAAAYEDALATLAHVDSAGVADIDRQVAEYRAFCLYALGRTAEAESVAEGMIRPDPFIQLDARDASPRIEAMFTQVRKRLLPGLIREAYRSARTAVDQKDLIGATAQLTRVRRMLDEAKRLSAWDDTLADLGVLVDGFLELSHDAAVAPAVATNAPAQPASAATNAPAQPASAATPADRTPRDSTQTAARVYGPEDDGIIAPTILSQAMPSMRPAFMTILRTARSTGLLQITIDETGRVENPVVSVGLHPVYDHLLLEATRTWRYRPATKAGVPVKYRKTIQLTAPR